MEKKTKKELRSQITDSIKDAITKLELPAPGKKITKLIDTSAKKLAAVYADVLKKEEKKKKKAEKFLNEAINGIEKKRKKSKVNGLAPVEL